MIPFPQDSPPETPGWEPAKRQNLCLVYNTDTVGFTCPGLTGHTKTNLTEIQREH